MQASVPRSKKTIILICLKIGLGIAYFLIAYFRFIEELKPSLGLDFEIYKQIYETPMTQWYNSESIFSYYLQSSGNIYYYSGSLFYYSPLFYVLFYPLQYLPFKIYAILGVIFYLWGLVLTYKYLSNFILWNVAVINFAVQFWMFLVHGNLDLFLFGIIMYIWSHDFTERWKGFLLGLCLFKGTVIYTLIFFLIDLKRRNKDYKKFIIFLIIGAIFNYGGLFLEPSIIPQFIYHITLPNHPNGQWYLTGYHYPWLWAVGLITFQNWFDSPNYHPYGQSKRLAIKKKPT